MEGHLVGSDETNIKGETTYRWLPGGFFLEQRISLDFMGMRIESLELIGYDPETKTFPSTVFSNLSPATLSYRWEVEDGTVKIRESTGSRAFPLRLAGRDGAPARATLFSTDRSIRRALGFSL